MPGPRFECACRPLPGSKILSKSTSAGSAEKPRPASQLPNFLDDGEDVQAAHPMQSPFEAASPPPIQPEAADLPPRHQEPAVREEEPPKVKPAVTASGSLDPPSYRDSSYTFISNSGSDHSRV